MRNKLFISLTLIIISTAGTFAQTTEFSYQGSMKDGANPANGSYDFEFALFDALTGGTQFGSTLTQNAVAVANGVFSVKLDFGNQFPGVNRYLEIRVRVSGGGGFTTLSPRQPVASSPYAVKSLSADNAANAANAANATAAQTATTAGNALQLGGITANQYVLTGDPRMSDARNPLPGSASYIQNGTTPQTGNFNLTGNGTVGNTLSAGSAVNAGAEYRIGGSRVIGVTGNFNLFLGVDAGPVNTGTSNTFVGRFAGSSNITANGNSFFGALAGRDTSIGANNAFFGASAGLQNVSGQANSFFGQTAGGSNISGLGSTFVGAGAGGGNTTGNFNAAIGFQSAFLSANLSNATAIGARSAVGQSNALILGSINGVNSATSDTNVGIGTTAPSERLHVVGNGLFTGNLTINGALNATLPTGSPNYIQNTTTPQASSNFNVSGDGTVGGTLSGNVVNAVTQYNIGANRILSNAGTDNIFVGANAAAANPTGVMNSFFGAFAGAANSTANNNSFFGGSAGRSNTTGQANSFFGSISGISSTTGGGNAFFGRGSGSLNSTGSGNSFIGDSAGNTNTIGSNNTAVGDNADVLANNLSNATAIGFRAAVAQNNSLVLGSINGVNGALTDTNVGIGTTAPGERLHVVGNGLIAGNLNISGFGSASVLNALTQFNLNGNRILTIGGTANTYGGISAGANASALAENNTFFGNKAGQTMVTAGGNSFFGSEAGMSATAGDNSFFGAQAGKLTSTGGNNSFFGTGSGDSNTSGGENSFFGRAAGASNTTGFNNTFVGRSAGIAMVTGNNNTLVGAGADTASSTTSFATAIGAGAVTSGNNTVTLGRPAGEDRVFIWGQLVLQSLDIGGSTSICLNGADRVSTCSSSIRYKSNIERFTSGIDLIRKLRPISFNWRDGGMLDLGLVAEDVAAVEPLLTTTNAKGEVEGVKYDRVGVVLINAIKEQQAQIEAQQELLRKQQQQIDGLTKLVCISSPQAEVCKTPEK